MSNDAQKKGPQPGGAEAVGGDSIVAPSGRDATPVLIRTRLIGSAGSSCYRHAQLDVWVPSYK